MTQPERFWMVSGQGPSSFRHPTRESAEQEAKRLARLDTGKWFYVVESVSAHRKIDVESVSFRDPPRSYDVPDDGIPF